MEERYRDVAIIGGGVAGLCAAIAAHDSGASVILLESGARLGGTASWSGGALWVPANHHLLAAGGQDSRDAALRYMRACAQGLADEGVYTAYLDQAPEVIAYLEQHTPLELEVGTMPDYQAHLAGGFYTPGLSRSLAPVVFDTNRLGDHADLLRRSPHGTVPFGYQEFARMDAALHPERIDQEEYARRVAAGLVGWGEALCGALLLGVIERDISLLTGTRVYEAARDGATFTLQTEGGGSLQAGAVILCCGGYEWNDDILQENFPDVPFVPATVPEDRGDAWRIAAAAGAKLGNPHSCWGWPAYLIPGEAMDDGHPLVRTSLVERALPHLVLVNARGERFVDESLPYHAILKVLIQRDEEGNFINLPAFHVFDQQFRDKYAFGPVMPGAPAPDWMLQAGSLKSLAAQSGIAADSLAATLAHFNEDVETRGQDSLFGRGTTPYGHFWGDPDNEPNPNLGTVVRAPFYAVPAVPSTIGTCGGPEIDRHGRVRDADGQPIPGLYAAGNSTAAISGPAYFGPGGTIGPALVFGVLAGRHAACTVASGA